MKIQTKLLTTYNKLNDTFKNFVSKAITNEKALKSIEYHKNPATKAILLTRYEIDIKKEIIKKDIALNYIACESLSISLINIFTVML